MAPPSDHQLKQHGAYVHVCVCQNTQFVLLHIQEENDQLNIR